MHHFDPRVWGGRGDKVRHFDPESKCTTDPGNSIPGSEEIEKERGVPGRPSDCAPRGGV
jgi:hypothetical protein